MITTVSTITPEELKRRLSDKEDFIILDVREADEREEFHIEADSCFIPLDELPHRMSELDKYKNKEIIIYCRTGLLSGQACRMLSLNGFKTVNLLGGVLSYNRK